MSEEKSGNGKLIIRIIVRIIILVAEVVLIPVSAAVGVAIDTGSVDPNALGHPVPVFTVIFPVLAFMLLSATVFIMIILSLVRYFQKRKNKNTEH